METTDQTEPNDTDTDTGAEAQLRQQAAAEDNAPPSDDHAATASDARRDPEMARLRDEVTRQRTEIARLTQLTSLYGGSGSGTPPAPPKKFEDLSDREMETELRRLARGMDSF